MKRKLFCGVLALALTASISLTGGLSAAADSNMSPTDTATLKVADISHYTTVSDWSAVASNLDAIYIKATESNSEKYTDPTLDAKAQAADSVKLSYGFYHYFWPHNSTADAAAQADLFYSHISKYSYKCVPVLDVEEANGMTKAQITADVIAFATEFKSLSGQDIMIYTYNNFININFESSLSSYKLWVANYSASQPQITNVWSQWTMWQYAGTDKKTGRVGNVSGIPDVVDCNYATSGIFINSGSNSGTSTNTGTNTVTGDGFSLVIDKNYTSDGTTKTFNATAALDGGTMIIVSTYGTGEQLITYQPLTSTVTAYKIEVGSSAVKSSVYLTKGQFNGTSIPTTYGLTQFVTSN